MKKLYMIFALLFFSVFVVSVHASDTAFLTLTGFLNDPEAQLSVEIIQTPEESQLASNLDLGTQQFQATVGTLYAYTEFEAQYHLSVSSEHNFNMAQTVSGTEYLIPYTFYIYGGNGSPFTAGSSGGQFTSSPLSNNSEYGLAIEFEPASSGLPSGTYVDVISFTISSAE